MAAGGGEKPKRACLEAARMMLRCFQESECMKKHGHTFATCVKAEPRHVCQEYREGYFECKRGLLDMRNRLRGNRFAKRAKQQTNSASS